jgi:outer membrane protein TolC
MRKLFYSISFLIAVIVINACSVGKKYQRPTVQLPQQFDSTAATDSSIAGIEWRNFFKDTTLISLIDSALNNSYDLQLAVKRIEEAEAYVKQAKMNYVPTVDVAASAVTSNPSNNSLDGKSLASVIGKKSCGRLYIKCNCFMGYLFMGKN